MWSVRDRADIQGEVKVSYSFTSEALVCRCVHFVDSDQALSFIAYPLRHSDDYLVASDGYASILPASCGFCEGDFTVFDFVDLDLPGEDKELKSVIGLRGLGCLPFP